MHFPEEFLHFLWRFRLFNNANLSCTSGQRLEIIHPGYLNKNAGPDFSQAKIKIDDTVWVGNVEIHLASSEWFIHNHDADLVYDAVILHVVFEDDKPVYRQNGTLIPSFVLKGLFSEHLLHNYSGLLNSLNAFPCENTISKVGKIFIDGFLVRMMSERLEEKSLDIYKKLEFSSGNWERVFYYYLAKGFGFKVNSLPFELFAASLPFSLFAKHRDQPLQIEALVFGQAGFLNFPGEDAYPRLLQKEYLFLKEKYRLKSIDVSLWKFLRMRPGNFPTIRLAQFSALMVISTSLFSTLMKRMELKDLYSLFEKLPVNPYWETHYHFNKETALNHNQLGKGSIDNLLINTVILFLYAYGRYVKDDVLVARSLVFLEQLSAEKNSIVQKYQEAGVEIKNAFHSQAILQLYKNYCTQKKCLNCTIGIKILNQSSSI